MRCDRAASQAMAKWRYDRPFDRGVFLTVQSDWVQCFVDEELCLVLFYDFSNPELLERFFLILICF